MGLTPPYKRDDLIQQINQIYGDLDQIANGGQNLADLHGNVKGLILELYDILAAYLANPKNLLPDAIPAAPAFQTSFQTSLLTKLAPAPPSTVRPDMSTFIQSTANSVVIAQQNLNDLSAKYNSNLQQFNGLIPMTCFSIPTLKAEMTVGVSEVKDHTLNLVLLRNEDEKKTFSESQISFEIRAAPPPPGAVLDLTPYLLPLPLQNDFFEKVQKLKDVTPNPPPVNWDTSPRAAFRLDGAVTGLPAGSGDVAVGVLLADSVASPRFLVVAATQSADGTWTGADVFANGTCFNDFVTAPPGDGNQLLYRLVATISKWRDGPVP